MPKRGGKKGDLSKAIAEAIQLWLKKQQNVLNAELWISFKDTISHTIQKKTVLLCAGCHIKHHMCHGVGVAHLEKRCPRILLNSGNPKQISK